uniref:YcbK family protein n=1 Tax=Methylobacterium sp. B34 TaxID=95563 RepID=UPI00165122DE
MNERVLDTLNRFQQIFPEIEITSGYRSPSYNAGVGGARSSRHMHGDAFDFSGKGVSEDRARDAMNWLRSEGAKGFGTYNDGSFHVDWKPGSNRAWGPDRHATSLSQTPAWFQENALAHIRGEKPDTQYATVPPGSIPNVPSAPAARSI